MTCAVVNCGQSVEALTHGTDRHGVPAKGAHRFYAKLPGTGKPCECGQHKDRCAFGGQHAWSLAFVDHFTGSPLPVPTMHCMACDSYCGIDPEEF